MTNGGDGFENDLQERTARFEENVIRFANAFPLDQLRPVSSIQMVRAAANVGANYCEADDAESAQRLCAQNLHLPEGTEPDFRRDSPFIHE